MKSIKKLFHGLSYLQYPLVLIAFILLIKPLFKGFDYLSSNPESFQYVQQCTYFFWSNPQLFGTARPNPNISAA